MADDSIPQQKTCTKCGESKSIEAFYRSNNQSSGRYPSCKACCRAHDKTPARRAQGNAANQRRRERARANGRDIDKEYYQRNRERVLAQTKNYAANNRERIRAYRKEYSKRNAPRISEQRRKYREGNPEIVKARKREWYRNNAAQIKAAVHAWQRTHLTHRRLSRCRTRGRKADAPGTVTVELWLAKCEYHGHRCYLCGKPLSGRHMDMEHRIPLSRGGSNWIANIAPACKQCNGAKGDLTEAEYRQKRAA